MPSKVGMLAFGQALEHHRETVAEYVPTDSTGSSSAMTRGSTVVPAESDRAGTSPTAQN